MNTNENNMEATLVCRKRYNKEHGQEEMLIQQIALENFDHAKTRLTIPFGWYNIKVK